MAAGPYSERTVWAANKEDTLLQSLDDVTVAFHKTSGDTHILNFLSTAIINVLTEGAETFSSARPKILSKIQMSSEDCSDAIIVATFLELDDVGLISPQAGRQ